VKHRCTIFYVWVGPPWFPEKAWGDTLRETCIYASGGICVSRSAYRCVRGAKRLHNIFHVSGGTGTDSTTSARGDITPNLCFCMRWDLRVTLCISGRPKHETSTHYFSCSGGPCAVSIKSATGHVSLNLCFYIWLDIRVT
jgi:hypothetical protein